MAMKKLNFTALIEELNHQGMCDASAAIAVEKSDYLIVANDEDNILRVYQSKISGKPVKEIELNDYFKHNSPKKEVDIEGAALLEGVVYWITSHGRNKKGKLKSKRRQFFATKITGEGAGISVKQKGISYENLLQDLRDSLEDQELNKYFESVDLDKHLAPQEKDGINIEGLCATPNKDLLIGFRNPIPDGKALLIPLKNPAELVRKKNSSAHFGEPIRLDLGGLGIRSIEYWEKYKTYIICAGAFDDSSNFCLYQWSGNPAENPEIINFVFPQDFRPESVLFYPNQDDQLHILSDDGGIKRTVLPRECSTADGFPPQGGNAAAGNCTGFPDQGTVRRDGITECKDLPKEQQYFRSIWLKVNDGR
jgi:hypothetical protein